MNSKNQQDKKNRRFGNLRKCVEWNKLSPELKLMADTTVQQMWRALTPELREMADFTVQQLELAMAGGDLVARVSRQSGVDPVYVEMFVRRLLLPSPYQVASIVCGTELELWLVARTPDEEAVCPARRQALTQSELGHRVWVKTASDIQPAFKRLLQLVWGEPDFETLSRLARVRVAMGREYRASAGCEISAAKLQAFWLGKESLSWTQMEALLAAARLKFNLCVVPRGLT